MARPRKTSRPNRLIPYSLFLALLTVLVGARRRSPADRQDFEELMALADQRMYFHKREYHKNRSRALVGAAAGDGAAVAG